MSPAYPFSPSFHIAVLFLSAPSALLELSACQKPCVVDAPPVERE